MNLFQIIFIAIGAVAIYEFFAKPYFQKRKIVRIEKETIQWANLIGSDGVFKSENEKKVVQSFLKIYSDTKFNKNQIALKLEVVNLLYFYVNTVSRLQMMTIDRNSLTILEKQRHQLENILKNLFEYLRDTNDENE